MELNPHIPKPDPPKEEEKVEEKKEEAEDKKEDAEDKKEEDKEKVSAVDRDQDTYLVSPLPNLDCQFHKLVC